MVLSPRLIVLASGALAVTVAVAGGACSATNTHSFASGAGAGAGHGGSTAAGNAGGASPGAGGASFDAGHTEGGVGGGMVADPTTCAEAAFDKTYVGCDFWPTVTANEVWSLFDFTVVVANAGMQAATVTVTGQGVNQTVTIAPDSLEKIYLTWVPSLKGGDTDNSGHLVPFQISVSQPGGAFHLVSSVPVTVYQFNALEYAPTGGPVGKDWSNCPGTSTSHPGCTTAPGCYSFTNDASLLLPSTALTGNYRITTETGWGAENDGAFIAVTATQAATSVTVYVAPNGHILAGGPVGDVPGGSVVTFAMNAGDVVELAGAPDADNAGTLVQATAPVQVITGMPCTYMPQSSIDIACDHLEQTVFPAETLGKHYFVAPPTSPHATVVGHVVRLVGNVDGTNLTYPSGSKPPNAPTTVNAGQVIELGGGGTTGQGIVEAPFEIQGDHEFAIVTFMLSATLADPGTPPPAQLGDPSQSNAVALEQYRLKYVFLAPDDYTESYADVIQPLAAHVTLDGVATKVAPTPIGSGYGIARIPLGPGKGGGAHLLTSDMPVGLQVIGYGAYTSYQYPGGLNLDLIAPPPPTPT